MSELMVYEIKDRNFECLQKLSKLEDIITENITQIQKENDSLKKIIADNKETSDEIKKQNAELMRELNFQHDNTVSIQKENEEAKIKLAKLAQINHELAIKLEPPKMTKTQNL